MPVRLAELQSRFAAIVTGDGGDPAMFAAAPVPIERALDVHRATIESGFARALALAFPTVEALVGPELFRVIAFDYHLSRPETEPTLGRYGLGFADFLVDYDPVRALAYLPDVARLDLAIERCQMARDGVEPFAIDPAVSIELPSSLAFLLSDFPVENIRWAIFAGDDHALAELDMIPGTRAIAVWRSGRAVLVDALPPAAAGFVTALMAGATADDALASTVGEHGPDILPVIRNHVFASRFARVRPQN